MNSLFLALAYLRFHAWRSAVLIGVVAIILAVPVAMQRLLNESEAQMTARAEATPLIIGNRGSSLDLVVQSLYFSGEAVPSTTLAASEEVWDSGLAEAIPLHVRFEAEGVPIVGTTIDYFPLRDLQVADGRDFAVLGEAVLGASAAADLGLGVGDRIVSSPQNLFDLGGVYPLRMTIVGVLAPSGTPDDDALFVDLRTAWIIEGIGHGHDDVVPEDGDAVAPASIVQFAEITEENIDSFHFHGDPAGFPITSVVAVPRDARSATILRGRYLEADATEQILSPPAVIGDLLDRIFHIKRLLDAVVAAFGVAALLAIALAMFMSVKLREREIETATKLGARRTAIAQMLAAEGLIILLCAAAFAAGIVQAVDVTGPAAVRWLLSAGL